MPFPVDPVDVLHKLIHRRQLDAWFDTPIFRYSDKEAYCIARVRLSDGVQSRTFTAYGSTKEEAEWELAIMVNDFICEFDARRVPLSSSSHPLRQLRNLSLQHGFNYGFEIEEDGSPEPPVRCHALGLTTRATGSSLLAAKTRAAVCLLGELSHRGFVDLVSGSADTDSEDDAVNPFEDLVSDGADGAADEEDIIDCYSDGYDCDDEDGDEEDDYHSQLPSNQKNKQEADGSWLATKRLIAPPAFTGARQSVSN